MIIGNYIVAVFLIVLGLYAVANQRNMIKIVLGMGIVDYGVNLLIVSVGYRPGGTALCSWQTSCCRATSSLTPCLRH